MNKSKIYQLRKIYQLKIEIEDLVTANVVRSIVLFVAFIFISLSLVDLVDNLSDPMISPVMGGLSVVVFYTQIKRIRKNTLEMKQLISDVETLERHYMLKSRGGATVGDVSLIVDVESRGRLTEAKHEGSLESID